MRRASIDIGSNSVRLMVVELGPPLRLLHDDGRLTRIGDSIARSGRLEGEPLEATLAAVGRLARAAREHDAPLTCIATAGLRDAANADEARRLLSEAAGAPVRVVSGEEEAALAYLGARAGAARAPAAMAVLDIGGRSTELAWGGERLEQASSRAIGARRLLELEPDLGARDPLAPGALDSARATARACLTAEGSFGPLPEGAALYGMGGTITTLAALELGLRNYDPHRVNDAPLTRAGVAAACESLRRMSLAERRAHLLEPERADLLLPGAMIVEAALDCLARSELAVSVYSLRLGVLTDAGRALLGLEA